MTGHDVPETGQPIGELPAVGATSTSERTDIRTADDSGTVLTIAEAVERYDVSAVTLGRHLRAGKVPGASKRPSPKGDEWVIPAVALVGLYTERATAPAGMGAADGMTAVPSSTLDELIAGLREVIDRDARALEAAEVDRENLREKAAEAAARAAAAEARAELLEADLERERARADALAADAVGRRRGLFRRRG